MGTIKNNYSIYELMTWRKCINKLGRKIINSSDNIQLDYKKLVLDLAQIHRPKNG